jgi:N6-adenosine-specific RNA methylase IME4
VNLFDGIQGKFGCILADPPWPFRNRTGKIGPEHKRLHRYRTMTLKDIHRLPVGDLSAEKSHLWLWSPLSMIEEATLVMYSWGWTYKTAMVWEKIRGDGQPDGRCCGFYMRTCTELLLLGVRGRLRTGPDGRRMTNVLRTRKREHSRKPDEVYERLEKLSPGPHLELFARHPRPGWTSWGDQLEVPCESS